MSLRQRIARLRILGEMLNSKIGCKFQWFALGLMAKLLVTLPFVLLLLDLQPVVFRSSIGLPSSSD